MTLSGRMEETARTSAKADVLAIMLLGRESWMGLASTIFMTADCDVGR